MNQPVSPGSGGAAARGRLITAIGLLVVLVAAGVGLLALIPGVLPSRASDDQNRVATILAQAIEADGVNTAATQYRILRDQGFPGLQESEFDTNSLGYALLRKGQTQSAIQVFQLNVETHPDSANVYDSLGEAYLAAGNRPLAIANYEKAIAIDPGKKSAEAALAALTGRERPPYSPLVLFHIVNGLAAIAAGAVSMSLRKGSRWHSLAGRVFVITMLSMSASAAYIAAVDPNGEVINVLMGTLTFYLVFTAWLTARRQRPRTSVVDWAALLVASGLAVALFNYGVEAAMSETGSRDGIPAGIYLAFAVVASLAAVLDVRMLRRGGVSGARRLTRHLWRMSVALFIAVTSFFLGQPQVFPVDIRNTGLLALPSLLVILALGYWLFRVNGFSRLFPLGDGSKEAGVPAGR